MNDRVGRAHRRACGVGRVGPGPADGVKALAAGRMANRGIA